MPRVHFANSSPTRIPDMNEFGPRLGNLDITTMLRTSPKEYIRFPRTEGAEATLELTSNFQCPITYKIQTTSPDKFRVRPRCGVLSNGESVNINIVLKSDETLSETTKDKFLILCMPLPPGIEPTSHHLCELWKQKQMNHSDVEQHRLCCEYREAEKVRTSAASNKTDLPCLATRNSPVNDQVKCLEHQMQWTQRVQYVTIFMVLVVAVLVGYLIKMQNSTESSPPKVPCAEETY